MFEELNAHRQAVQENIRKAFEVGFTGNEYLEKAYQVGDEATDKHGVTYYVHALNAAGKPLWRKKKDSGAKATNSGSAPINTQSQKKVGKDNSDISFQLFDRKSGHKKYYEIYPIPNELKNSSFIRVISAQDSKSGRKEFVPEIEFKDGEKFSERLFSKKDAIDFIIERILEKRDKATNSSLTEQEKKEKSLLESAVRSGRRLSQRDANRLYALQRKERQAATTANKPGTLKDAPKTKKPGKQKTKMKVDDTTIDQVEYDKAYKIATSATETEEHLKSSLAKIEANIKETKAALAYASNVTADKLQKMLTASVSKKKAIEDALNAKTDKDSKSLPFVNKTIQQIKEKYWGDWNEQKEKSVESILRNNEKLVKKFMSMTFPAAGWSSLHPEEKSIDIGDNESIIFSAYKSTDTTSRNPAFRGSTDYYYRIYYQVGYMKKEISRSSYSSASKSSTLSERKNDCKIKGLIALLHI